MQVSGNRGAGIDAVVEADVQRHALCGIAEVVQQALEIDAAGAVHVPFLGDVLVCGDDHVVGHQRKRVHPDVVFVAGHLDFEADLQLLLLPADVFAAQETTVVNVPAAGRRIGHARTVETQSAPGIVLDAEEPAGIFGMTEYVALDAGQVVLDEAGLALLALKLREHRGQPASPDFQFPEPRIKLRPCKIVVHFPTRPALGVLVNASL